ncbi:MAG: oligosaccharide flippase family protein [Bacilli bacterium]
MLKKYLNNKFFISTLILLIGGAISKILGFILKIFITRSLGTYGVGIYSLLNPTYSFLIVICIFSMPIAVSSLIATEKENNKKVIISSLFFICIFNTIIVLIVILLSSFISNTLLHEPLLNYPIMCIGLVLPFIGISSVIKGYFWGKQKMFPYVLSNIIEQITRISILFYLIPIFIKKDLILTIGCIILTNIISETVSIIVMLLFIPKDKKICKEDIHISRSSIKEVISISLPATSSKIVGSIAYFLEPIILFSTLLYVGYSKNYIIMEYGIINGYSLSLLLLPSFFTQSISTSLVPELSKYYQKKNYKKCISRIKQICIVSFIIGLMFTTVIYIFSSSLLSILFNTSLGINYIKILAPFILLYFIELPLSASLEALKKSRIEMNITLITSLIRLLLIFILSLFKIGLYSLIISIIFNLIFTVLLEIIYLKKMFSSSYK